MTEASWIVVTWKKAAADNRKKKSWKLDAIHWKENEREGGYEIENHAVCKHTNDDSFLSIMFSTAQSYHPSARFLLTFQHCIWAIWPTLLFTHLNRQVRSRPES